MITLFDIFSIFTILFFAAAGYYRGFCQEIVNLIILVFASSVAIVFASPVNYALLRLISNPVITTFIANFGIIALIFSMLSIAVPHKKTILNLAILDTKIDYILGALVSILSGYIICSAALFCFNFSGYTAKSDSLRYSFTYNIFSAGGKLWSNLSPDVRIEKMVSTSYQEPKIGQDNVEMRSNIMDVDNNINANIATIQEIYNEIESIPHSSLKTDSGDNLIIALSMMQQMPPEIVDKIKSRMKIKKDLIESSGGSMSRFDVYMIIVPEFDSWAQSASVTPTQRESAFIDSVSKQVMNMTFKQNEKQLESFSAQKRKTEKERAELEKDKKLSSKAAKAAAAKAAKEAAAAKNLSDKKKEEELTKKTRRKRQEKPASEETDVNAIALSSSSKKEAASSESSDNVNTASTTSAVSTSYPKKEETTIIEQQ